MGLSSLARRCALVLILTQNGRESVQSGLRFGDGFYVENERTESDGAFRKYFFWYHELQNLRDEVCI